MKTKQQLFCYIYLSLLERHYKLLSIERLKRDCTNDELIYDTTRNDKQYDTIQTSVENDVSHTIALCCVKNHRRPRSPNFEKLCLGKFEV